MAWAAAMAWAISMAWPRQSRGVAIVVAHAIAALIVADDTIAAADIIADAVLWAVHKVLQAVHEVL